MLADYLAQRTQAGEQTVHSFTFRETTNQNVEFHNGHEINIQFPDQ
jgi:hypothetical protein